MKLRFWIASQASARLPAILFVATIRRIDIRVHSGVAVFAVQSCCRIELNRCLKRWLKFMEVCSLGFNKSYSSRVYSYTLQEWDELGSLVEYEIYSANSEIAGSASVSVFTCSFIGLKDVSPELILR